MTAQDLVLAIWTEHFLIINEHGTNLFSNTVFRKLLLEVVFCLGIVHQPQGTSLNCSDRLLDAQSRACFILEGQTKMLQTCDAFAIFT